MWLRCGFGANARKNAGPVLLSRWSGQQRLKAFIARSRWATRGNAALQLDPGGTQAGRSRSSKEQEQEQEEEQEEEQDCSMLFFGSHVKRSLATRPHDSTV
jgi:hypothetical protein